jgi:hypothetical protein
MTLLRSKFCAAIKQFLTRLIDWCKLIIIRINRNKFIHSIRVVRLANCCLCIARMLTLRSSCLSFFNIYKVLSACIFSLAVILVSKLINCRLVGLSMRASFTFFASFSGIVGQ